jgi:hypothetical protein
VHIRRLVASAFFAALALGCPDLVRAQATEGAVFLLAPIGARGIGLGHAGVSVPLGVEGIWWNPASIGWISRREVSVDYAKLEFTQGTAIDLAIPAGRAGTFAAAVLLFDEGTQEATDKFGNPVGRLYGMSRVLSATYAAPFGDRVSVGVTYKDVRRSQTCSGGCADQTVYDVPAFAIDFGIHMLADSAKRLRFGAAIRNVGIGVQTIDAEQTDPLPTRIHIGATYSLPSLVRTIANTVVDVTGEVVAKPSIITAPRAENVDLRFGLEARFSDVFTVRAGLPTVKLRSDNTMSGDGSKAVIGLGFRSGTLRLDMARSFGGISAASGQSPTYVSIHIVF